MGTLGRKDEESHPQPPQRHAPAHTFRGRRHGRLQWLHGGVLWKLNRKLSFNISCSGGFKTPQINWSWKQGEGGSDAGRLEDSGESAMILREVPDSWHFAVQIKVPQSLAERTNQVWESLLELAECGNLNCKSDLQVVLQREAGERKIKIFQKLKKNPSPSQGCGALYWRRGSGSQIQRGDKSGGNYWPILQSKTAGAGQQTSRDRYGEQRQNFSDSRKQKIKI